jgi:hypothetical protein
LTAVGTLPTSGVDVVTHEPTGLDELIVMEGAGSRVETMLALARRLVRGVADWSGLPAGDLGAAALLVRRTWLGETIRTDARCAATGCGERIDIAFDIDTYLEHHRPRRARGVTVTEPGWFVLAGSDVAFRIPTVADLTEAPEALVERCVRPSIPELRTLLRIERALEALAPPLAGELAGVCPACGAPVTLWFEPIDYVLAELRDASTSLFEHVHELALAYHWPEPAILALGRRRRHGYVDLVRGELVA